jgi:hypothetical protein
MGQILADRRDMEFALYEQLGVDQLCNHERYAELDRKTLDLIMDEASNLAVKREKGTLFRCCFILW